jgi:hypothetical protein
MNIQQMARLLAAEGHGYWSFASWLAGGGGNYFPLAKRPSETSDNYSRTY